MPAVARPEPVVLHASAAAELLTGSEQAAAVAARLAHLELHVPAHFDADVLAVLGRLHRAGQLESPAVEHGLERMAALPATRHSLVALTGPAWQLGQKLCLVDALYLALAEQLELLLVTTDHRLSRAWPHAESVPGPS